MKPYQRIRKAKSQQRDPGRVLHLVDFLALGVAFSAVVMAALGVWVARIQANVMERAFQEETKRHKEENVDNANVLQQLSSQAAASAKQASAMDDQLKVVEDQYDIALQQLNNSEEFLNASRYQVSAMARLLEADKVNRKISTRLADAAEKQAGEFTRSNYENYRSFLNVIVITAEMTGGSQVGFDINKPYNVRSSIENISKNSALFVISTTVGLVEKGGILSPKKCDDLNCGETIGRLKGGRSVLHDDVIDVFSEKERGDIISLKKHIVIRVRVIYKDEKYDKIDIAEECLYFRHNIKVWNTCDSRGAVPLSA
jgi:hypothetical protein